MTIASSLVSRWRKTNVLLEPSRQAYYQVMRSLRSNCLGEKPCELEILSDKTEAFEG